MGENFQLSFARGELNVFGAPKVAIELEGEHAAQGGAIAYSVTGKRVVNFTSGQGVLYGLEQYYHAPGKLSTMVVEIAARALTKASLNVHCGHDDIYAAFDTGWNITFGIDAQQAADQALILRRVNELSLNPGMNAQDGFLTSHLERTFKMHEPGLIRRFLGRADDIIECPTDAQRTLFGPKRRRVPEMFDLKNPMLLGSVQNQEHYMTGVTARRQHFSEHILGFFEQAYEEFGKLTGRYYGLISEYNNDGVETTIVALGSGAENAHAAVDYIQTTRGEKVGVVHVNVLRPCPEAALIDALRGKKNVIVLERTDDQLAGDGPLARDIRTAFSKAVENKRDNAHPGLPAIDQNEVPRILSGVYGLGSRDFRPEGILGAYEFATGKIARQDGKKVSDGASFFYVGVNHPYAVISDDTPSCLPDGAITIRFHSIGGWGMITTGKNLSEMFGELGGYIVERDHADDPDFELLHISANPKYGSEKKGAPTNYFLVVAPERVRVNCDLQHVNVVLCCDPKIFTHTNPLVGLEPGGAFVWESGEKDDANVWQRIPKKYRQEIIDKDIKLYVLPGFEIACAATDREDLQYRMQGNSFLGAFFMVSTFLHDNAVPDEKFLEVVRNQYVKKFGKLGDAVVDSNMTVMQAGFEQVREVPHGDIDAPDTSSMRGEKIIPLTRESGVTANGQPDRPPVMSREGYDAEFRADYGYFTPASPLASTGAIAAATGETVSKYVARRKVPMWKPENCTQCMACIVICPDTALPNTAQDIDTVLTTAIDCYVEDVQVRTHLKTHVQAVEKAARAVMLEQAGPKNDSPTPFHEIVAAELDKAIAGDAWFKSNEKTAAVGIGQLKDILSHVPFAYAKTPMIFKGLETKQSGSGGVFGIYVTDKCKGCGECVEACGDHNALVMVEETEIIEGVHQTGVNFLDCLPETDTKYLGKFDPEHIAEAKAATLQNHLMIRSDYDAMRSGDGACAGCGEKTILRAVASLTEAYLRPIYHAKADRMDALADQLEKEGLAKLEALKSSNPDCYTYLRKTALHTVMGFGGENEKDTDARIEAEFTGSDADIVDSLKIVLRQDAFNHRDLQAIDGGRSNGMSVMAMGACTGCNSVYGSTVPANPHPYPWMNSLFQDSATTSWLFAESFIDSHGKRSVIPERISRALLDGKGVNKDEYWRLTHFCEVYMTDAEVNELPRVWAVGGDGAFGDIGYQNVSKAVMQNRPNLQILMLDTQVYSNTGGQNSESSPMTGGFDMNQFGPATEGKLSEMKGVAESLTSGHASPFVAQTSVANTANLYQAIIDALAYRGVGYLQTYTACQPEHGIPDDMSAVQAGRARDSRGLPEFTFNSANGEAFDECISLKGNPTVDRDWWIKKTKKGEAFNYTVANWAHTEARFRRHIRNAKPDDVAGMIRLDEIIWKFNQQDIIHRNFRDPNHRAFVPKDGVYTMVEQGDGLRPAILSRQMVLFTVERRKAWRMLQSKAGIVNYDRLAHERVLREFDAGRIPADYFHSHIVELIDKARSVIKEIGPGTKDKKTLMDHLGVTA